MTRAAGVGIWDAVAAEAQDVMGIINKSAKSKDFFMVNFLSFPIQHDQPDQADKNPNDIHPRDFIFKQENRHWDKDQRGNYINQDCGDAKVPAWAIDKQETELDPYNGDGHQNTGPI